jgi:hypothetical protein
VRRASGRNPGLAFFIEMRLWDYLSKKNKRELSEWYLEQFGKKLVPPKKDKPIHCEVKIEDIAEIDRLMREPGRGAWHE